MAPKIVSTHLDSFTFRRNPETKEIECVCNLTLVGEEKKRVVTLVVPIEVDPPWRQTACDLAMFLHGVVRTALSREIGGAIDFTDNWTR